jgi:hypothetical protein
MFVLLYIYLYIFKIQNRKPQSTIIDGAGHEGQSLTENNEDSTLKDQLQRINQFDNSQL